jgi:putative lipoic acid-binding regulatory protein
LEFPCEISLKIFGRNEPEFRQTALAIMRSHFPDLDDQRIEERLSKADSYLSLTVKVRAQSRAQMDDVCTELCARPEILMVL